MEGGKKREGKGAREGRGWDAVHLCNSFKDWRGNGCIDVEHFERQMVDVGCIDVEHFER